MSGADSNSILVIDDSPEQIRYVSELMQGEDCRVYAALSCKAAEKVLEKKLPDLILLDIVMPDMDGFTFCRKLKGEKRLADIPIIFATAYEDKDYIGKSFEAGGSDYVVKPFLKEELLERIKVRIRLAQKEKELKRAYAELDSFCYTVSHDIRAPLYVIKQLTALLQQEVADQDKEEADKICGMLSKKAEQAAAMTEELHRFSKVFYEELQKEEVDMEALFSECFEGLSMLEQERNISYRQEKLSKAYGDTALLRLAVQNILSNAIKFTREKKDAVISVSEECCGDKNCYLVTDNGIGIERGCQKEIFKVFRKLHSDAEYEGDGIGLAAVRRIMLRHGGDVEITSVLGEGTAVRIILPGKQKGERV